MRKTRKVEAGQTLYSLNVGNAARRCEQVLTPVVVDIVGRKYFTVIDPNRKWYRQMYTIDGWYEKTKYSADTRLYNTAQEWYDEKETAEICKFIYQIFEYGHNKNNLSLDTLRKIQTIIKEETE